MIEVIFGIGTDIIEIGRIDKLRMNRRFLDRCFTSRELDYFESTGNRPETIAGTFCAKEAVSKAFGTGIGKLSFKDIEVVREESGRPVIVLSDNGRAIARDMGISSISISISHCRDYAVSFATAEKSIIDQEVHLL